jgi:hypothetical protein
MHISMNTTSSRRMAYGRGNFGLEIRKRLAKAFERLSLILSGMIVKRVARRELKNHEAQRYENGYEAKKRILIVKLRYKISEKQGKWTH